jgi:hypothetical protein
MNRLPAGLLFIVGILTLWLLHSLMPRDTGQSIGLLVFVALWVTGVVMARLAIAIWRSMQRR